MLIQPNNLIGFTHAECNDQKSPIIIAVEKTIISTNETSIIIEGIMETQLIPDQPNIVRWYTTSGELINDQKEIRRLEGLHEKIQVWMKSSQRSSRELHPLKGPKWLEITHSKARHQLVMYGATPVFQLDMEGGKVLNDVLWRKSPLIDYYAAA